MLPQSTAIRQLIGLLHISTQLTNKYAQAR
jgi:hypothetical protein